CPVREGAQRPHDAREHAARARRLRREDLRTGNRDRERAVAHGTERARATRQCERIVSPAGQQPEAASDRAAIPAKGNGQAPGDPPIHNYCPYLGKLAVAPVAGSALPREGRPTEALAGEMANALRDDLRRAVRARTTGSRPVFRGRLRSVHGASALPRRPPQGDSDHESPGTALWGGAPTDESDRHAFGERPVLKLMYAALIRATAEWRGLT